MISPDEIISYLLDIIQSINIVHLLTLLMMLYTALCLANRTST